MLWADLLSLVRIPLGLVFFLVADRPWAAVTVLAVAALTDMFDGMVARRVLGPHATGRHRGDWLDPLCDKLFVAFVLAALVWVHGTPVVFMLLLLTREILQVIALLVFLVVPSLRHRPYNYRANRLGKLTTVLQFVIALLILFGQPPPWPLLVLTTTLGVTSLATYIARIKVPVEAARP